MILVSGNGTLAKELVKLSTKSLPIVSLSKRDMDITDEFKVSEVIKKYRIGPSLRLLKRTVGSINYSSFFDLDSNRQYVL